MIPLSPVPVTAYLSLGSNVGDRLEYLRGACRLIGEAGVAMQRTSSIYETEPVDNPNQGWFLNCVVEVATTQGPIELLHALQRIEQEMGRERTVPKGPRTVDVDILLYGDTILHSDELTLPHPRLLQRRFVLEPLRELAPRLVIPGSQATVSQAHARLRDPAVVRLLMKFLCA